MQLLQFQALLWERFYLYSQLENVRKTAWNGFYVFYQSRAEYLLACFHVN